MALNCFHGTRLEVGGNDQTPTIPSGSRLVLTQAALSAESTNLNGGRITINALGYSQKVPLAVATLDPSSNIFHVPLSLVFTKTVTFSLVAADDASASEENKDTKKKPGFGRNKNKAAKAAAANDATPAAGTSIVELIGYYEMEDDEDESELDVSSVEDGIGGDQRAALGRGKATGAAAAASAGHSNKPAKRARK